MLAMHRVTNGYFILPHELKEFFFGLDKLRTERQALVDACKEQIEKQYLDADDIAVIRRTLFITERALRSVQRLMAVCYAAMPHELKIEPNVELIRADAGIKVETLKMEVVS